MNLEEQEQEKEKEKDHSTHSIETDQNTSIQTILHELKSIKETILHLGAKEETSYNNLATNATENIELKKIITTQNAQIISLLNDNKVLKQNNKTLEKDIQEIEDEMLRLKVDITGIPESPYEMYDHLRGKIAKIMMTVSKGNMEQARWETAANIPITDCRRMGIYKRNFKRTVRITFLYMKHKNCLLSRKSNLPSGIFVDDAFSDSTKRNISSLRPILKLAKTQQEYKH